MSVTNYTPNECRYRGKKLKNYIYLLSTTYANENIKIDKSGISYIEGLTEVPIHIKGWNISLEETSSLDERYKFTKTIKITVKGKRTLDYLGGKYYVIFETDDGIKWLMNPDFKAKVTYNYNLSDTKNETEFTFTTPSNFPSLKVSTPIETPIDSCNEYYNDGIKSLKFIEENYVTVDITSGTVYTYGKDFASVKFNKNTFNLNESYDGNKVTTTITFGIDMDNYKSSWHYNLLEFMYNEYAAIAETKGGHHIFSGFEFGLQPSFTANVAQDTLDTVTITLTEVSDYGSFVLDNYEEEEDTRLTWIYVKNVGNVITWDCAGLNRAKYLVQAEIDTVGNQTGRYKCLEGYEDMFSELNIVGVFTTTDTFVNPQCTSTICQVKTNLPSSLTFREVKCYSYSYSAACDWSASTTCEDVSISPSSGLAGFQYSIDVCATEMKSGGTSCRASFTSGDNERTLLIYYNDDTCFMRPSTMAINCLKQNVTFTFDSNCPIQITSIDPSLSYTILDSYMTVNIPKNNSTSSVTEWEIGVKNCDNETCSVAIYQDHIYERWVETSGIICQGTTSYKRLQRYTGTTSTSINTPTQEYAKGDKILDTDSRCSSYITRWAFNNHYYCYDGDKYKAMEEEISYDNGTTWTPTYKTRLGDLVEAESSWCNQEVDYEWRLSDEWQCGTT